MTKPLEEVYNFYLCMVYQFIDFMDVYRKNPRMYDLKGFCHRIMSDFSTDKKEWKRLINYYKVYAEVAVAHPNCNPSSVCNTTVLMYLDLMMFNDLRTVCKIITDDKWESESIKTETDEFLEAAQYRLRTRMYSVEASGGDPIMPSDWLCIKDVKFSIYYDYLQVSFPDIEDRHLHYPDKLIKEGKCDFIARAKHCAEFMNSIRLDDRELLANPNWKPVCGTGVCETEMN